MEQSPAIGISPATAAAPRTGSLRLLRRLGASRSALLGALIATAEVLIAAGAPLLAPYDPVAQDLLARALPPLSPGHLLGTDELGRDLLSRLIYGTRTTLAIAVTSVAAGLLVGVPMGLVSGYYPRLDAPLMRLVDVMLAFPGVLLAIVIVATLGPGITSLTAALAIFSVPGFARLSRSLTLAIKSREMVEAARALGASDARIMFVHVLPNMLDTIVAFATLRLATAMLSASALSFLGLGVQAPTPELGAMIAASKNYIFRSPHLVVVPGLAIAVSVLGFNLLGDGIQEVVARRRRG